MGMMNVKGYEMRTTSELRRGDVVQHNGLRVELDRDPVVRVDVQSGRRVWAWDGRMLNADDWRLRGIYNASWLREGRWTIQGNDLAVWSVEVS